LITPIQRLAARVPRLMVVGHDLAMVLVCWVGLQRLRYGLNPLPPEIPWLTLQSMIVVVAQGLVFWRVGLYRGLWRFASMPDLWNILRAGVLGLLAIMVGLVMVQQLDGVPRSTLVGYPFALMLLLGTPRLLYRAWKDNSFAFQNEVARSRVLILGAGASAEGLLRDLRRSGQYVVVGMIDDDRRLHGAKVQGIPVLGSLSRVKEVAREVAADLLVIAMPTADAEEMQRVMALCDECGLPVRTMPRLEDILEGQGASAPLKEVAIEDLLGRAPIQPDWPAMREWLGGRTVMVTGAGGSIGSELCRQCAQLDIGALVLVERSEYPLIQICEELDQRWPGLTVIPVLGDCGDPTLLSHTFTQHKVDAVFHAAAHKQVPILEGQLREAVRNNLLVTETIARASRDAGVGTFVFISTDKAVNPINVLGATKRMAEMACQALAPGVDTRFITVRFGNVLGSAGSVVPLFNEQIRRGGPVTVTHPDVTRFFMTIPEACQLILQAASIDSHEAIYTLDMGKPVRIRLLAEQMIRLAGKRPDIDVPIRYIGLRPGEKLHEVVFHPSERHHLTTHPKILRAEPRDSDPGMILTSLKLAREAVHRFDEERLLRILRNAVPEYVPETEEQRRAASAQIIPLHGGGNP